MKIGDRVIAINGINVSNAALEDAMGILHQSELETILVVEYDVSIMGRYQGETHPLNLLAAGCTFGQHEMMTKS